MPHDRIARIGAKDNFWSMGDTGPCGPCTEIFYDHGEEIFGGPPGTPDEDGDRYIEIWNLVFMQFDRASDGTLTPLPKPSVDTGMGLERLAAVMQNVHNNYDIDLFQAIVKQVARLANQTDLTHNSLRVIADHIRSCAFTIVDGVLPSNEGRGYVLRRIIRRAIRHGYKLGMNDAFFYKLVPVLAEQMGEAYPELVKEQANVERALKLEEERFAETLENGMKLLEEYISTMKGQIIDGEIAFKLYDTYGFPLDLTQDILKAKDIFEKMPLNVQMVLKLGLNEHIQESPTEHLDRVNHHVVVSNPHAKEFAKEMATTLGMSVKVVDEPMDGEVTTMVQNLLKSIDDFDEKCIVLGGECTVSLAGDGKGGRNQHLALLMLKEIIKNDLDISFLSAGTDGIDGNSDAAGGVVDKQSAKKVKELNLDIDDYLKRFDSYNLLKQTNDLIITGPSGTNVIDIVIIIKGDKDG